MKVNYGQLGTSPAGFGRAPVRGIWPARKHISGEGPLTRIFGILPGGPKRRKIRAAYCEDCHFVA